MKKDKYRQRCAGPSGAKIALPVFVAAAVSAVSASASAAAFDEVFAMGPDTKTFFFQFVVAGGPIVWVILLPMSVITGYLAIDLALSIRRNKLLPKGAAARITAAAKNPGPANLPEQLKNSGDLLSRALSAAINRSKQAPDKHQQLAPLAADALQGCAMRLFRKVEWCNIIGNVAPMVGLFGTVFGMIKAFNLLGISGGQPRPDQLAAAISIALITTFWGLLIAIPALAIAGIFHTRIQTILTEAAIELEALIPQITLPHPKQLQPAGLVHRQPQQPMKTQFVPKVPVKEVSGPKKNAKQPLQTKQTDRTNSRPVQTQPAKSSDKQKYQTGPAPDKARRGRRQFPAKPGS